MDKKERIQNIKRLQQKAINKKAQAISDKVNVEGDAEAEFNKVFNELLDNMDIPSLDNI